MNSGEKIKNKEGKWFLQKSEDTLKNAIIPHIPAWIETYHLTALTILWSALMVWVFILGKTDHVFLYLVPLLIFLQYITDLLDGSLGRYRDTGLVKWGYYADHFFDFIFMCSVVAGYGLLFGFDVWIFFLLAILSGYMVHTFLKVSVSDGFEISFLGLGPTEGRLFFILAHSIFVFIGIQNLLPLIPAIVIMTGIGLVFMFLITQRKLWKKDFELKNK